MNSAYYRTPVAAGEDYVPPGEGQLECQKIAEIALDEGYDVIAGINYVIYDNFDKILQPQMVIPIGAFTMDNRMKKYKLIVAHGKCLNCGTERILYFTPDATYGERIVSTKSGSKCAYVNILGENIIQEIEKYCTELCLENGIIISSSKLVRIVSSVYGITCDEVDGERIDTIPNTKCPNCLEREMVEDDKFGEQLKEIEAVEVTHNFWERLEDNERKEKINQELRRQGYLDV